MHHKEELTRVIETGNYIVGLRADGIVHVYYKDNTEINVALQMELLEVFNELTGKKKSLFIFEAGHYCSVTKEARENAIIMEPLTPTLASVVFVQNIGYRLIAEFYYKVNKPIQPYKVVSKFEDGIKWLKSFVEAEAS